MFSTLRGGGVKAMRIISVRDTWGGLAQRMKDGDGTDHRIAHSYAPQPLKKLQQPVI